MLASLTNAEIIGFCYKPQPASRAGSLDIWCSEWCLILIYSNSDYGYKKQAKESSRAINSTILFSRNWCIKLNLNDFN